MAQTHRIKNSNADVILYSDADTLYTAKPNLAEAHNNLGIVFKELGKFNESIDSYQRAIQIKSDYAEAFKNIGNVLIMTNKVDEAISNYEKAIKINTNFIKTFVKVGNFL